MSDFIELKFPESDGVGRWYIWAIEYNEDGEWYSLVSDGSGNLKPPYSLQKFNDEHLFNTEQDAHVACMDYYFKHARTYPYMDEWAASITVDSMKGVASRVMEFEK